MKYMYLASSCRLC